MELCISGCITIRGKASHTERATCSAEKGDRKRFSLILPLITWSNFIYKTLYILFAIQTLSIQMVFFRCHCGIAEVFFLFWQKFSTSIHTALFFLQHFAPFYFYLCSSVFFSFSLTAKHEWCNMKVFFCKHKGHVSNVHPFTLPLRKPLCCHHNFSHLNKQPKLCAGKSGKEMKPERGYQRKEREGSADLFFISFNDHI